MGIYSSGSIFGIKIYNFNDDDYSNILYEKKYDVILNDEHKEEAYLFYNNLNDKNNIHFQIYTECCDTQDKFIMNNYMSWYPLSQDLFLKFFSPK